MTAPNLARLVEQYRAAALRERQAAQVPGQRAKDRAYAAMGVRTTIDEQLRALGEHDLRGSLLSEHWECKRIAGDMLGRLDERDARGYTLDDAVTNLQFHRRRIEQRLADLRAGVR